MIHGIGTDIRASFARKIPSEAALSDRALFRHLRQLAMPGIEIQDGIRPPNSCHSRAGGDGAYLGCTAGAPPLSMTAMRRCKASASAASPAARARCARSSSQASSGRRQP
ncbi:MAG TPA: hypothetical protein PLR92_10895, partial [Alicycliphilus denitrificans]|nr:hypothetical protein [Alicycliphilus denitrificans]